VHGRYDYIINDFFHVSWSKAGGVLEIYSSPGDDKILEEFIAVFFDEYNAEEVLLIEGLLFLSMGVFHQDSLQRQQAMVLQGIQFINDALKKMEIT
jgi:hypothetical protein